MMQLTSAPSLGGVTALVLAGIFALNGLTQCQPSLFRARLLLLPGHRPSQV
jgi:hypothetical protein